MRLGVLFSGGKDSSYAFYKATKAGHEISCLISIDSSNKESFMFHTPSIKCVREIAAAVGKSLVLEKSKGVKEEELLDLRRAIERARKEFGIEGVVTGAVESVYQATRIQKICFELGIWCFNPLWLMNQKEILREIVKHGFRAIVVGVGAYPLGKEFLGREIDSEFLEEVRELEKEGINPAGEGGEYETLVIDGPIFKKGLEVASFEDIGKGNSWRREVRLK